VNSINDQSRREQDRVGESNPEVQINLDWGMEENVEEVDDEDSSVNWRVKYKGNSIFNMHLPVHHYTKK
jgi:hypothetical protein